MEFYQLQTISCYDIGKSSIKLDEYCCRLEKLGYKGGGISDFKNLMAFPYLNNAFKNSSLKPIFSTIFPLKVNDYSFYVDLVILNETGYLNLIKLYNLQKDNYVFDDLNKYKDGLACILKTEDDNFKNIDFLNSNVQTFLKLSQIYEEFYFGIEIYSELDSILIDVLRDFIKNHSYLSIAFPKIKYLDNKDGYKSFKILEAINNKTNLEDEDLQNPGPYFLLTKNVVEKIYLEDEIKNIETLVNKIDFKFIQKRGGLLEFENIDSKEELHKLAFNGLKQKIGENPDSKYLDRLNYELEIIDKMHFNDYFLIVGDYVNYFRNNGVKIGPGRGSACGCLVAFCLNITLIDPIKYNLYFERFLNPLRKGMPDIDVDIEDTKRDEVINYLKNKYGQTKVGLILTFSNLQMKAAIRRIGMVFNNIPSKRIDLISNTISKKCKTFEEEIKTNNRFRKLCEDSYYLDIINKAKLIMEYPLTTSIHASGVIVSKDNLSNLVPLNNGNINTCLYEFETLEEMGFLKLDVLGLSNLTFLHDIENLIISHSKKLEDPYLNLEDKKTYEVLNRLDVVDIFQLDSFSAKNILEQIKVNSINDLALVLALNRPGPIKNVPIFAKRKNQHVEYKSFNKSLDEILKSTYGILIYQEQIIEIAKKLALFDASKADQFRKAVSKKDSLKMHLLKDEFINGCIKNNISELDANKIFDLIQEFANYGFNKSHAVAYSFISYALAYYKANYKEEFYQVSLNKTSLPSQKFNNIYKELYKLNIDVVNPDINISSNGVIFLSNKYYLGFDFINKLNKEVGNTIVKNRKENGKFKSLEDFLSRIDLENLSNVEMVNFINSGVLDTFKYSRKSLLDNINQIQLSYKFNIDKSNNMLPCIKEEDNKFDYQDYLGEIDAIGVNFSMNIANLIAGKKKYHTLFIVSKKPIIYENRTCLFLAYKFGEINIYYQGKLTDLNLGDVVSIDNLSSNNYYKDQIILFKEKVKK